jgi:hypothetical protein
MRIFSNSQFDVEKALYVFNQKTKSFSRIKNLKQYFEKIPEALGATHVRSLEEIAEKSKLPVIFLLYESSPSHDPFIKNFKLTLFLYNRKVEEEEGIIFKAGDNKDYETKVKGMIEEAWKIYKSLTTKPEYLV